MIIILIKTFMIHKALLYSFCHLIRQSWGSRQGWYYFYHFQMGSRRLGMLKDWAAKAHHPPRTGAKAVLMQKSQVLLHSPVASLATDDWNVT